MATLLNRPDDDVAGLVSTGTGSTDTGSTDTGSTDTGSTDTGDVVPGDVVPDGAEGGRRSSLVERARWLILCLGFLALTLSQQPGRIVADTKLDLTADPWGFLGRALHLWEPEGFSGQVQNQAYGYLFPMGPFFAVGQWIGLPSWVVQRLWMAALLSLAFLGVVLLARRLRIGTPAAQVLGGLAYALAPRMIMGLGATSIEVLPMALTPWVLIPLVAGARGGSPRRAAGLSGLAVFCIGGVNAVATGAALPLAGIYLLTRPAGPRRRRLMAWWAASVALATAWWVAPLLLLRDYSPPFLDFIENAGVTTTPTGLFSTLRGTSQWVAYLADGRGPVWPLGFTIVHGALPMVATVVLVVAGLLGLMRAGLRDRSWLIIGALTGLTLVTAGHLSPVQGVFAGSLHDALDGVLAPMRNVHKFDPVLRLPLALGVAHLCGLLLRVARVRPGAGPGPGAAPGLPRGAGRLVARTGVVVVVLALVTLVSPAVAGRLSPLTGFTAIPAYWQQTADYLADAQPSGRALLLPASSYGTYIWGTTADEPLQALADSPWTVRSAVPLSQPGNIRMLNAVEERLARGEGSPGLAGFLGRSGISYLVVRNDLDAPAVGSIRPILVSQALQASPGITRVATFGPLIPSSPALLGRVLDERLATPRPAVEVYAVRDAVATPYTVPLDDAVSVAGGPEGLLALEDRGVATDRPAFLSDGKGDVDGTTLVSDAQLRRERTYGRITDAVSGGLTADASLHGQAASRDYLYPGWQFGESVVRFEGGSVSASGSRADADSLGGIRPEDQPYAAVDGDPTTAWRPSAGSSPDERIWWRAAGDRLPGSGDIVVQLAAGAVPPAAVEVVTDAGVRTVELLNTLAPQHLPLPVGPTRSVALRVPTGAFGDLALAEVEIPGLSVSRTVVTPAPTGATAVYAFDAADPARSGCATEPSGRPRCAPDLVRGAAESTGLHRVFTVAQPADYDVGLTVVPRAGAALDALIESVARPLGPAILASSAVVPDPRAGPDAATDSDLDTSWIASAQDPTPSLTLSWLAPRTVDRIRLVRAPDTAAATPTSIGVSMGGLAEVVPLDADGVARFAPRTTDRLTITFPARAELSSYDPYSEQVSSLGIGVAEVQVAGLGPTFPATPVTLPCGQGPAVEIDGELRETSLRTTLGALRALEPVHVQFCTSSAASARRGDTASTGRLSTGQHRFVARSTGAFAVSDATLTATGSAAPVAGSRRTSTDVQEWGAVDRRVGVAERDVPTLLVVPENTNSGWVATLGGHRLETRVVDGWQQAYVVPAGPAGAVHLRFEPDRVYRGALLGGAAAVLLLGCVFLVPARAAGPAPAVRRRRIGLGVAAAAVAGTTLVGGVVGLVTLGVATAGAALLTGSRRRMFLRVLAVGALVVAGAVWSFTGGAGETATQTLVLMALSAVVASLLLGVRVRWPAPMTPRNRRSGRSTSTWIREARAIEIANVPMTTKKKLPLKTIQPSSAYPPVITTTWTRNSP